MNDRDALLALARCLRARSLESPEPGYVTVTVADLSRESMNAMLSHLQKLPETYTPLGVAAAAFVEALSEALREKTTGRGGPS